MNYLLVLQRTMVSPFKSTVKSFGEAVVSFRLVTLLYTTLKFPLMLKRSSSLPDVISISVEPVDKVSEDRWLAERDNATQLMN